jgi:hypothetical protein
VSFNLFKTYIRNPSLFFISFFTLPPTQKWQWQPRSARAYIWWVLPSWFVKRLGANFSCFAKIRWLLELLLIRSIKHEYKTHFITPESNRETNLTSFEVSFVFHSRVSNFWRRPCSVANFEWCIADHGILLELQIMNTLSSWRRSVISQY